MIETSIQNLADAINNLATAIRSNSAAPAAPVAPAAEVAKVKKPKAEAPAATTEVPTPPAAPKEAPAKVETPAAPAVTRTIEELMALGHKLVAASKQDVLKAINAKHGDAKLSTTPPEKFAAKYADLLDATKGL